MKGYADYCPIAVGVTVLGDRWTPLVIRELMVGAGRFNEPDAPPRRAGRPGYLQRIAVRYQMTGMTPEETSSYIRHHLQLAGRDGNLFSDDATAQIHDATRGKPRAVNNLAIAALIATYTAAKKIVD
jgi:hypothetical protein